MRGGSAAKPFSAPKWSMSPPCGIWTFIMVRCACSPARAPGSSRWRWACWTIDHAWRVTCSGTWRDRAEPRAWAVAGVHETGAAARSDDRQRRGHLMSGSPVSIVGNHLRRCPLPLRAKPYKDPPADARRPSRTHSSSTHGRSAPTVWRQLRTHALRCFQQPPPPIAPPNS